MSTDRPPFRESLLALLREVFFGLPLGTDGSWFVEGEQALFPSAIELGADGASRRLPGSRTTLGAHFWHATYYLSVFNAIARGESPNMDWEGSWAHEVFGEEEWTEVLDWMRREFDEALYNYENAPANLDEGARTAMVANIAHAAYHLGAIRTLMSFSN